MNRLKLSAFQYSEGAGEFAEGLRGQGGEALLSVRSWPRPPDITPPASPQVVRELRSLGLSLNNVFSDEALMGYVYKSAFSAEASLEGTPLEGLSGQQRKVRRDDKARSDPGHQQIFPPRHTC